MSEAFEWDIAVKWNYANDRASIQITEEFYDILKLYPEKIWDTDGENIQITITCKKPFTKEYLERHRKGL